MGLVRLHFLTVFFVCKWSCTYSYCYFVNWDFEKYTFIVYEFVMTIRPTTFFSQYNSQYFWLHSLDFSSFFVWIIAVWTEKFVIMNTVIAWYKTLELLIRNRTSSHCNEISLRDQFEDTA